MNMHLTLQQIQARAYATAKSKGWHDKPLRTVVIGYVLDDPAPGSQVFVTTNGEDCIRFCGSPADYGEALSCPGRLFGQRVCGGQEVWTTDHDRVLRMHALMHTEITEAADAFDEGYLSMRVEDGKPEGFVVELADLIVRVCDTTAALGLDLRIDDGWLDCDRRHVTIELRNAANPAEARAITREWIDRVRRKVDRATECARVDDWQGYVEAFAMVVLWSAGICKGHALDLGAAIEAKMSYNETRPHRHGGKQA